MQMFDAAGEHPKEVQNVRALSAGLDLYTQKDGVVFGHSVDCRKLESVFL